MGRVKPLPKILGICVILGGLYFGFNYLNNNGYLKDIVPAKKDATANVSKDTLKEMKSKTTLKEPLVVGVVTWGGYAGGQYFNKGFNASENSRYWSDYGILVQFKVIDDYNASRDAFKSGAVDVLWTTADSFPTEAGGLKEFDPVIIFQSDWSRGGDAIVVREGINSINDLRGKKISVAQGTPSHTFLLWLLNTAGLTQKDVTIVVVPSAIDSATTYKAQQVDAAVVWSPDDIDCVKNVTGTKILKSTKGTNIIADVFYVKRDFLNSHRNEIKALIEGWMKGAAEINTNIVAKQEAAKILAIGLNQPENFCLDAINNVRLTTIGDNKNFFNVDGGYAGVKGEDLYTKMSQVYQSINLAKDVPSWRNVVDTSLIREINLSGNGHEAEQSKTYTTPTKADTTAKAISTKRVTITFASNSSTLDGNAKYIINKEFLDIARACSSRIRIEGNTDSQGSQALNKQLSLNRAQAVVNYLVSTGFDKNRFVVVGNGSDNPVSDNNTEDGRSQNRRTDFELID
jgi:NitT/TauT family transport system substrate-binding protein